MVDEAQLCSPTSSTFEALAVGHAVGRCPGEELGPFIDQCLLQALQFSEHLIFSLSIPDIMVSPGFRKL